MHKGLPEHTAFPEGLKHTIQTSRVRIFEDYSSICLFCGWWIAFRNAIIGDRTMKTYGGLAGLKKFDLENVNKPLNEVRDYLVAKYDARFKINPKVFEQVVGDVFKDQEYNTRVTAYSADDGIDVILDGKGHSVIGIQVKRYKNAIQVDQIRELPGAMVINGITRGIFVTTSDFQSGAERTAAMSAAKGYPIELHNAGRFYDALTISQVKKAADKEILSQEITLEVISKTVAPEENDDYKRWY